MVSVDTNKVDSTFNMHSPLLKRLNHCQQLLTIYKISRRELALVKAYRMKCAIRRGLGENAPESVVGGVRLDGQREVRLEVAEDWSESEGLLEGTEGCVRLAGPDELDPLAGEGGEGSC